MPLGAVETLHLSDNKFVGTIPSFMFTRTTRLVELNMANNKLNSTLPSSLGNLRDLSESMNFVVIVHADFTLTVDVFLKNSAHSPRIT